MKRTWLALCAVLLIGCAVLASGGALAQTSAPSGPINCLPATGPFSGLAPGQATGVGLVTRNDGWGQAWGWWCVDEYGNGRRNSWVVMHSYRVSTNLNPRITAVLGDANPLAAAQRLGTTYQQIPTGSEKTAYDNLHAAVRTALTATRPPAPVWLVANATNDSSQAAPSRPAYGLKADGTRDTTLALIARATAAAPCECWRRALPALADNGHARWCPWRGGPTDAVTLCRRKPGT